MRAVLQRVSKARVLIEGAVVGEIAAGLVVLLAVGRDDTPETPAAMAEKIINLRIFSDDMGKMNRSLLDTGGAVLAVSQFTLYGDARGQRRPSFLGAAPPDAGKAGYEQFIRELQNRGIQVATGVFQTHMSVELANDGPTTIRLDSEKKF
jgi:D-tyrosyl-tRNA(Tyr) deacylase